MFDIFKSKGNLRTLGGILGGLGMVLSVIPEPTVQIISQILLQLGGLVGGTGVVRAVVAHKLDESL